MALQRKAPDVDRPVNTNKLTRTEREGLLRILRANVKAAKAAILSREAELKPAFEIQLDTIYAPDGDPVWNEAYKAALKACQPYIERIEQRCNELSIGTRYRPKLRPPSWQYGDEQIFKELRIERRKIAHAQIEEKLKKDAEELERKSATMQMEIIAEGFITEAARQFMATLPNIDQLIPPLRIEELAALVEGKALPSKTLTGILNASAKSEQALLREPDS
jgi:hypothetical protein